MADLNMFKKIKSFLKRENEPGFQAKDVADLDIIRQIEKEINVKLKKLDKIKWNSKGYTVNQHGQVIGLGLCKCEIKNLNRIIAPLSALPNLTQLNVSHNQLSDISPLSALPNLTQLDVSCNQLIDISPLSELTNLTALNLQETNLSDIFPLKSLRKLTELNVGVNQLTDISIIKDLQELSTLIFHVNQIDDISVVSSLHRLKELFMGNNKIVDISAITKLINLTTLHLVNNEIVDISPLKELRNLQRLDLHGNPIEKLPPWITDFNMEIRWKTFSIEDGYISFYDNPLKTPPPEIVKQGKEAVRNYFEQLQEQEEDYLFEAKMLIVGEPGAGKTSLAWKMEDADCDLPKEEETTRGIDVKQYYFPLQKEDFSAFKHPQKLENRNFCLNLWDFGGQEIYKATHRFFLSKRSLYALVADSRNEDTDFNYWLHIVEMFGGDSPLLIVLNEKYQRKRNLDIAAMRTRFSNISEVLDVDFAEEDKGRLHKLERAVKYYVSQLPHIGSPVPAKWTDVREALEQDKRNTISLQDYLTICQDNGIAKRQDALVLSQYFHDIGVFLHFQEDELLNRTIFLKPNWATHAVYKILDHPLLNQQHGRFNKADANTIWCEDEYAYLCNELLRLMQKFFLTYQIDHSGEYIVPERLLANRPEYPWDDHDNLVLQYTYDVFMPRGILSQFTVLMHRYISNHDYVWKRGVVLERDRTSAEIIESYDARSINIRIAGQHKRDFMTIITEQFDQINGQYERMNVDKLIPCNCVECKSSDHPHFFEYKKLKRRIEKGQPEVQCEESYKIVNVRGLIDDVINPALRGVGAKELLSQQENRLTLHKKIVEFLTSLPNIDKTDALRALLYRAGLDQQLHDQIEVAGPPAQFFQLLVSTLSAYGTLEDGRNPLKAILESAKGSMGQERRAYCDALIQEIEKIL